MQAMGRRHDIFASEFQIKAVHTNRVNMESGI